MKPGVMHRRWGCTRCGRLCDTAGRARRHDPGHLHGIPNASPAPIAIWRGVGALFTWRNRRVAHVLVPL